MIVIREEEEIRQPPEWQVVNNRACQRGFGIGKGRNGGGAIASPMVIAKDSDRDRLPKLQDEMFRVKAWNGGVFRRKSPGDALSIFNDAPLGESNCQIRGRVLSCLLALRYQRTPAPQILNRYRHVLHSPFWMSPHWAGRGCYLAPPACTAQKSGYVRANIDTAAHS